MNIDDATAVLARLYAADNWPAPFHVLRGLRLAQGGLPVGDAARHVRTTAKRIESVLGAPDLLAELIGAGPQEIQDEHRSRARRALAQLLVGRAAEVAFEEFYRAEMGTQEFELKDLREGRTDTDYRLLNGRQRPLYRINIKFIGSSFRRAPELVGLQPDDCFPLATYKIFNALKKQEQEHLPYIFLVVFVRTLSVELIGSQLPPELVEFMALLRASVKAGLPRRDVEDRMVDWMVRQRTAAFSMTYDAVRSAAWYILSARKADKLLRELLFDRVYALKVRGFAQQFRGAELDMHFSLEHDLVPLAQFLEALRDQGQTVVASMLERGTV